MTDKLASNGMTECLYDPECTTCNDGIRCFSNYHSCANVRINGTIPRSEFKCPVEDPSDWPYRDFPSDIYYPKEVGEYTEDNLWLKDVPQRYVTPVGPCI